MPNISVGSVTVDIVPDTRNFRRDLEAKTQDLSVNVDVRLRDKVFEGELKEATRDRTVDVKVDDKGSIRKMQGNTHGLLTALALLAPAAAPLTAVAIGGTVALGALGAAGYLAFKGISAEMAAGTPLGVKYSGIVQTIKTDLQGLEAVAAKDVFGGIDKSAALINGHLPQLRSEVDYLARSLGSDLAPVTAGLLGLFHDLDPSVNSIADGIHGLAVDFEQWANGPGGVKFANYLATELPIVAHTLESLGSAGAHVVQALLPLGGPVLQGIELISGAISHIPVRVIEGLFVAFAGYKVLELATAATAVYRSALGSLGVTAATTAVELDALAASEGAAAKGAGASGAAGLISKVGPAALGGALGVGALKTLPLYGVGAQSDTLKSPPERAAANFAAEHPNAGSKDFSNFVTSAATDPKAAAQLKAYESANYKAKTSVDSLTGSVNTDTAAIKAQNVAFAAAITASDKLANAALGLAGANISAHQALADANTALKANGHTLDLNTQKGRDNRTALLNLATALHSKVDADLAANKSQKKVNDDQANAVIQLQNMAIKFGLSKTAAHNYALALLGIPKSVITSVTVNGIAKSEAQIAALKKKEGLSQFTAGQRGSYMGGLIHRSEGGSVFGAGTATSDSIPALLSNGEFVIKAATVKHLGVPFLTQLNQWTPSIASGAYAAGAGTGHRAAAPVNVNIYPAPGMSETAIGTAAARKLEQVLAR